MTGLEITVCVALVALTIPQAAVTLGFLWVLWGVRRAPSDGRDCPKTALIMCLRGRDPFLDECLESVLNQDYPNYRLHIVVDSRRDAAWETAEALVERYGQQRVCVEVLEQRLDTCSLKCSSLVQAIERLDDSVEVVALADADTLAHPAWLRELVAGLADEDVGVATGNRWYMPADGSWSGLVRYLWNAAAIVQMYWYGVPWGGTLAVKRKLLKQFGLLDRWRHAFCEDTMLYRELGKHGRRVKFVPSLMMVNREDCTMSGCLSWLRRQLLTMRLYHPRWPVVLVHGFGTTLILAAALGWIVTAALRRDWSAVVWCGGGLVVYELIMVGLLAPLECAVRRIAKSQGGSTSWLSAKIMLRLIPAIVLTQVVYTIALAGAQFVRVVDWRGIRYRVYGSGDVRRLNDSPYTTAMPEGAEGHSL